jgi:hypothetical protein
MEQTSLWNLHQGPSEVPKDLSGITYVTVSETHSKTISRKREKKISKNVPATLKGKFINQLTIVLNEYESPYSRIFKSISFWPVFPEFGGIL